MKPWHNCPRCPDCKLPTMSARADDAAAQLDVLHCLACGHTAKVTAEEYGQARAADAAWDRECARVERLERERARVSSAHQRLNQLHRMRARGDAT